MITISEFLDRYVTPVLTPLGFKKTGATYRLIAENGDQALINFQQSSGTAVAFYVNVGVAPRSQSDFLDYRMKRTPRANPTTAGAALEDRVAPPAAVQYENGFDGSDMRWSFTNDSQVEECGRLLAVVLVRDVVPVIAPLLDRKMFLAYIGLPDEDRPFKSSRGSYVKAPLLIDEGPSAELDAILTRAAAAGDMRLVDWAEDYLRRKGLSLRRRSKGTFWVSTVRGLHRLNP